MERELCNPKSYLWLGISLFAVGLALAFTKAEAFLPYQALAIFLWMALYISVGLAIQLKSGFLLNRMWRETTSKATSPFEYWFYIACQFIVLLLLIALALNELSLAAA